MDYPGLSLRVVTPGCISAVAILIDRIFYFDTIYAASIGAFHSFHRLRHTCSVRASLNVTWSVDTKFDTTRVIAQTSKQKG